MGVPGLYSYLKKNKHKMVSNDTNCEVDSLYLDTNCLIHPQCFKTLELCKNITDVVKLENTMMRRITLYIDYLVNYVKPTKLVYVSIDGVAPLAKLMQQRSRRFKSVDDAVKRNEIKKKHGKTSGIEWSNTVITPGTQFMENLHVKLLEHFNQKKGTVKYIYSSYHTVGEGEHKILNHIRSLNNKSSDNNSMVIYGLDADLIFLALASKHNNIFLLRETDQINGPSQDKVVNHDIENVAEDLTFVSIDMMQNSICRQVKFIAKNYFRIDEMKFNSSNIIDDFIFICYFLGNDFLPHLPSIDIKKEGLDIILNIYIDIYLKIEQYIINYDIATKKVSINEIFLEIFLSEIAKLETVYFRDVKPKHDDRIKKRKCRDSDQYMIDLWNLENMVNIKIIDKIKLGKGNSDLWKFRYYEHYYGSIENQPKLIDALCDLYLEGLIWVARYYFTGCDSWEWNYKYTHAPFISDLAKFYTQKRKNGYTINNIVFGKSQPLLPFEQLLSVLPPQCSKLLPLELQYLMTDYTKSDIIEYYPMSVSYDMINKDLYWQCIPMLPSININKVKKYSSNIIVKKKDYIRNINFTNDITII